VPCDRGADKFVRISWRRGSSRVRPGELGLYEGRRAILFFGGLQVGRP